MTRMLLKHEALRTRGFLLVIAGAALALALGGSLLAVTGWPVLSELGTALGLIGALGLLPAMQLAQAIDYWRSGYGRIGYFTQTLPVRGSRIYLARLLWAGIVLVAGLLVSVAIWLLVVVASAESLFGSSPAALLRQAGEIIAGAFDASPWLVAVGAPLLLVVLYGYATVLSFCAASVGSEPWLQRLGWGGPVLLWFLLSTAMQLVMFAFVLAVPLGLGVTPAGDFGIVSADLLGAMLAGTEPQLMPLGFALAMAIAIPVMAWRTARSWDRKVSLA
jgi:hypothetical protein